MKTPEHFEKRPTNNVHLGEHSAAHVNGYNEALEKTNAKELYAAAVLVVKLTEPEFESDTEAYNAIVNLNRIIEELNQRK